MLGVSIYVKKVSLQENIAAIKLAKKNKIPMLFFPTRHLPDFINNPELLQLISYGQEQNFEIGLEISKHAFDYQQLQKLNPTSIWLDNSFSVYEIVNIIDTFPGKIQILASDNDLNDVIEIFKLRSSKRIRAWYNCYPKPYTGMEQPEFLTRTLILQKYGINLTIFLSAISETTQAETECFPTIEDFRYLPLYLQLQWFKYFGINNFIVANKKINHQEIALLTKVGALAPTEFLFKISSLGFSDQTKTLLLNKTFFVDWTSNQYLVRLVESSNFSKNNDKIMTWNNRNLIGNHAALLVDNYLYGRYRGEIYFTKRKINIAEKTNYLANCTNFQVLIDLLKPPSKIMFIAEN
ncbi:MupG family TIM beta-alpha barrel fold protein [Spiroplasma sp. DGKH1]|uniref:MupG family TIM beta-alpha barrel fold protein n=1 Tax=Spiroplasma sp. DGKH1 TaxID=3050074 RepID=UPI0034C6C731